MPVQDVALDNTMGAAPVGTTIAAALYGGWSACCDCISPLKERTSVSCIQTWYYLIHQNDSWPIRYLVITVVLFDTIHQVLISHTVYTYLITNYGNVAELNNLVWSMLIEVLFNGFIALLAQGFLTMRVWRLSDRNIWITGVVLALVLGEFGSALAFTGLSLHFCTYTELAELKYLSIMVNALAAAGNVLIAATLCTLLHRSRTGFRRSDTMINKLILFAVNTGFLTSLCAVASLILIIVAGDTFLYIAFFFCIGRLYSNTLLATLNVRKMIRGAAEGVNTTSENVSLSLSEFPKAGTVNSTRPTNVLININTTQEFTTDSDQDHEGKKIGSAIISSIVPLSLAWTNTVTVHGLCC
ncbi:hypothetical protein BD779DRAFT_1677486 [Infundibulicybe gibba]|nr:hypothetical protein BD779DRAFT_1677486 [Infundibulicybe gibba]